MATKYVITASKNLYLCITKNDRIFTTKSPRNATRLDSIERISFAIDNMPLKYKKYQWCIENCEETKDKCCRYELVHIRNQSTEHKSEYVRLNPNNRKILYENYNGRCAICGKPLSLNAKDRDSFITFDHIMPRSEGGQNRWYNLQASCYKCNQIKGSIVPEVFKNNMESVLLESIMEEKAYQYIVLRKIIKIKISHFVMVIKSFLL